MEDGKKTRETDCSIREVFPDAEKAFGLFMDNLPALAFIKDLEGRYLLTNRHFDKLFGLSREDAPGKLDIDILSPDLAAKFRAHDKLVLSKNGTIEVEEQILVNGEERIFHSVKFPFYDKKGEPCGICTIATDRTDIKHAEQVFMEGLLVAFRSNPAAIAISSVESGQFVEVNDSFVRISGYSRDEALGRTSEELGLWEDRSLREEMFRRLRETGKVQDFECVFRIKEGQLVTGLLSADMVVLCGENCILTTIVDITDRKKAEDALARNEERYRMLADYNYNWESWIGPDGRMIYVSPSCERITGYPQEDFMDDPGFIEQIIHEHDLDNWKKHMEEESFLDGRLPDYRIFRKNGRMSWISQTNRRVKGDQGEDMGLRCSMQDITDRKFMEKQLHYEALHDPLTGLANRVLCLDRISQAMERAKRRTNYYFAVIFMDLDRFKVVNDSLGHNFGDKVLQEVSDRLLRCVRDLDTVSRFGGDEFVLLLEEMPLPREAIRIVKRVRRTMNNPIKIDGHDVLISASFGIVFSPMNYEEPEELLQNANIAMHRAKESGRNRVKVFNARMLDTAIKLMTLEGDMRRVIGSNEFFLEYQPMFALSDMRLKGFEALVRWNHSTKGLLPPSDFIPMAEETGLILELGQWVLEAACRVLVAWRERLPAARDLTMSVNISGRQFSQHDLVDRIFKVLQKTKLPPDRLKLEITETSIMEDADASVVKLEQLKRMGIKVSIDDFGTGYSSMNYLQKFPLDNLKIDLSFVQKMDTARGNIGIVRAIIELAHSLELEVVAEGVEKKEHYEILRELGCELGQGFLFSRPVDLKKAEDFILSMEMDN